MATEAAGTLNDEYVGIKVRLFEHNYGLFKEHELCPIYLIIACIDLSLSCMILKPIG